MAYIVNDINNISYLFISIYLFILLIIPHCDIIQCDNIVILLVLGHTVDTCTATLSSSNFGWEVLLDFVPLLKPLIICLHYFLHCTSALQRICSKG